MNDPPESRIATGTSGAGSTASRELDIVYDSRQSPPMFALFDPEADTRWIRAERSALVDLNTMD
jgi:hypothetical protein